MQKGRTRRRNSVSMAAKERIARAIGLKAHVIRDDVKLKNREVCFHLESFATDPNGKMYVVTIKKSPHCTCKDFMRGISWGKFTPCKHMYVVYIVVLGMDVDNNMMMHQPHLSVSELYQVFCRDRNVLHL